MVFGWGTHPSVGLAFVQHSLNNLNSNTPVLRQILNQVPLGTRVNSDATTQASTPKQYEENNYDEKWG